MFMIATIDMFNWVKIVIRRKAYIRQGKCSKLSIHDDHDDDNNDHDDNNNDSANNNDDKHYFVWCSLFRSYSPKRTRRNRCGRRRRVGIYVCHILYMLYLHLWTQYNYVFTALPIYACPFG